MIISFVDMEAKPILQQQNPNILAIVRLILLFLKTFFTKEKKSETETALSDKKSPNTNPVFLLYFMYIALLDKNLARSKQVPTFSKLKSIMLYGQPKIEDWETILLRFLNDTPREQGLPWTEEEKEVWKLFLFLFLNNLEIILQQDIISCWRIKNAELNFLLLFFNWV